MTTEFLISIYYTYYDIEGLWVSKSLQLVHSDPTQMLAEEENDLLASGTTASEPRPSV